MKSDVRTKMDQEVNVLRVSDAPELDSLDAEELEDEDLFEDDEDQAVLDRLAAADRWAEGYAGAQERILSSMLGWISK